MSESQLELFKTISPLREYLLLPKYKRAIPRQGNWQATLDHFLNSKGDYKTSIADIKSEYWSPEELHEYGYTILELITRHTSHYDDWRRKTYPVKNVKPAPTIVYGI